MDMRKLQLPRVKLRPWIGAAVPSRRHLPWLALAVLLAGAAAWWFFGRGTAVSTADVTRGSAAEIIYATGAIEPDRWGKVATLVKGRIIWQCRCEGEIVKAGDDLARLDDAEAQAVLRELHAREEFSTKEYERQTKLAGRGHTSMQAVERTAAELAQIQAMIAAQTERLSYYRLTAPINGMVLREDGEVGQVVESNVILYLVGDPRPLLLVAEVNEEDIPKVEIGQTVLLRHDAFADRRLTGIVREITPAGDPVARTYRIRVALPGDTPLRIGMSVEANVVAREKDDVPLVPAAAVRDGDVFLIEGGRAVRHPVEVGIRGSQRVEIVSGLEPGERVISPLPSEIRDGMRVRVTSENSAAGQ
jgi:membrane fusion protein, multidrug efflux system